MQSCAWESGACGEALREEKSRFIRNTARERKRVENESLDNSFRSNMQARNRCSMDRSFHGGRALEDAVARSIAGAGERARARQKRNRSSFFRFANGGAW